ncbi:hypothetical protein THOM_3260 [Trachipleistophora hominis]|uniref:Uncharacterized protein n=1 Tax=Trachipleistophora hominis TaxID=72359 RepID=L7JRB7_TRAHO|nr:hypothetical protein THOM_3260 [Trachipleistophora hominis]
MSIDKAFEDLLDEIDECEFALRALERKAKPLTQFVYTAAAAYKEEEHVE